MLPWPSKNRRETPASALSRAERQAARIAGALPPLLVEAERIAATVAPGVHGRRRVGPGESFWQFRPYLPGDPVQSIDWRQTAKSSHAAVRQLEWEAAQSVLLWRSGSETMNFCSEPSMPSKQERASVLLLALTSLLARAGEQVSLVGGHRGFGAGRADMRLIAQELAVLPADDGLPPQELSPPPDTSLILLGDFLSPPDRIAEFLALPAANRVQGHLMLILDPAEWHFPYRGRVLFESLSSEGDLLLPRADRVGDDYRRRIANHVNEIRDLVGRLGWRFHLHLTDASPEAALLALVNGLAPGVAGGRG